MTTLAVIAKGS